MEKKWMMFRSEANNQHYIHNGTEVINITPTTDRDMDDIIECTSDYDVVLKNTRKKVFVHNKARYIVVARGTFVES